MIQARKKQKANLSVMSKSSGVTMNNTRGSRNMVYEYNKSQVIAKEESFHKVLDENDVSASNHMADVQSYSEREPSIRASELKSDFRTGRSSVIQQSNQQNLKAS